MISISKIIYRNGEETYFDFDKSKFIEVLSKASIRAEEKKVEKQLRAVNLFAGVGALNRLFYEIVSQSVDEMLDEILEQTLYDYEREIYEASGMHYLPYHIYRDLMHTRERLEKRREELRTVRKRKTESVTAMKKRHGKIETIGA